MMSESSRYPTEVLFQQANRLLDHVESRRQDHAEHDAGLADAAGAWPGVIGSAIEDVRTVWGEQHEAMHKRVGEHGTVIMNATTKAVDIDDHSSGGFRRAGDDV